MEGFEQVVKLALENEGFVVTGNVKFPPYEVDVIGARNGLLVLSSVKSYFGSRGVKTDGFIGLCENPENLTPRQRRRFKRHVLFNEEEARNIVISEAANRFGYSHDQIELRFYAGRFASLNDENVIREHLASIRAGKGPIRVFGVQDVLGQALRGIEDGTYRSDPVISTLRAMVEATRIEQGNVNRNRALQILRETLGLP